ncbi:MAG: prolipoprotein diacylglyceryl transferase family protein, partial [Saprospiraceae bacterium]
GAKFFDVFDNWQEFLRAPARVLLSGGGLAFFGGLILGFIAVVSYMYRQKIPFLPTADAVAPALTAGYGVGRIGCQLSGDGDWGLVSGPKPATLSWLPDWMWGFTYPHNVLKDPDTLPVPSVPIEGCHWEYCLQLSQPVFPTPFYEVVMMIGVFGILWALRKRISPPGLLFFIYIGLIAIERFAIEKIRVNVHHNVLGIQMSQAEIIAVSLFIISVVGGIWTWQRVKKMEK